MAKSTGDRVKHGGDFPIDLPPASLLPDVLMPIDALTGEEAPVGSVLGIVLDSNGKKRIGFIPLDSI